MDMFLPSVTVLLAALGLGAVVRAGLAGAFDGTTRPVALAIAVFGVAAYLAERQYFMKSVHG